MITKRRLIAAGIGLLASGAGIGASMPVAAWLGGQNPAVALGSRVIDLTPGPIKDAGIRALGENDKPVLLGSVFFVMALVSAGIGLLSLRSRKLALGVALALNLVIVVAAVIRPTGDIALRASTIIPSVVSIVVGLGALWLLTRPRSAGSENEAPEGFDRRAFLALAVASGVVAVGGAGISRLLGKGGEASRAAVRLPKGFERAKPLANGVALKIKGLTPYLTSNKDFYRVDTALNVPQIDAKAWELKIHGMVDKEITYSFEDILNMPLVERRITMTCVSNEVGGKYVGNATWIGVRMKDLLERSGVSGKADALKSTSVDDMVIGTPLSALTDDRDAILAIAMNGEPLPLAHGFPARMVTPGLYGYVSGIKWVTDMEVTRFKDFKAYWTTRGWDEQAEIKTQSRIDTPRQLSTVDAGKVMVAGVAWAQNTGIDYVEIRFDNQEWVKATLNVEDGNDTWRQWYYEWDAKAGSHKIDVRATDKSGYTQTSEYRPPRPDGASGWFSLNMTVA